LATAEESDENAGLCPARIAPPSKFSHEIETSLLQARRPAVAQLVRYFPGWYPFVRETAD